MLKKIVQNFFSSGIDHAGDSLLRLKFIIVNAFTLIGLPFVLVHGVFNLLRQFYPLGAFELIGAVACIGNALLLRRTKNIRFAGSMILVLMLLLFIILLVFGGEDKTGLFWFFTFPLLAFFLKNRKHGFVWVALQFAVLIGIFILSRLHVIPAVEFTVYEIVLCCLSLAAVALIVFSYEHLKNDFIVMQKRHHDERLQKKILDDQFAIAERIQQLLIPQEDRVFGRLVVSGFYKAAAGVGGDYYDFFVIDPDHTAVIICDVSGKSVSAAFVMVNIRSIFQQHIGLANMNPAAMVKIINKKLLADSTNDIFAALSVYLFNSRTLEVEYCNAGYGPFAYFSKKDGRFIEEPFTSLPAGVIEDESNYVNRRLRLAGGDIIVSYTDGLLESFEKKNELCDKETVYRLVKEHAAEPPAKIKQAIIDAIGGAAGPGDFERPYQRDDISLVVSKVI